MRTHEEGVKVSKCLLEDEIKEDKFVLAWQISRLKDELKGDEFVLT